MVNPKYFCSTESIMEVVSEMQGILELLKALRTVWLQFDLKFWIDHLFQVKVQHHEAEKLEICRELP